MTVAGAEEARIDHAHPTDRTRRAAGVGVAVLTLAVCAPALAAIVTRWGSDYLPLQDVAVIDLRVRDTLSGHVPLTGVYSQFGWNHPGPLLFWVLAPIVGILGSTPWALVVAGASVQVAAIVATAVLAWRWSGPAVAALAVSVTGLSLGAVGPEVVLEAWNPYVIYPVVALFVLAAWKATDGPGPALAVAAGTGSFLVQAHVGYLPLAAAAALWWLVVVIGVPTVANLRAALERWRRWVGITAAVLLVVWIGPLLDVVLGPPGNAWRIVDYFAGGGSGLSTAGPGRAVEFFATSFRVPLPWLFGPDDTDVLTGSATGASPFWLLVPLVLVVVGAMLWRGASWGQRRALELVWILNVVGLVSLSSVQWPSPPYLFLWRTPLAVLLVLVTGVVAVARVGGGRPLVPVVATAVVGVAAIAVSVTAAVDVWQAEDVHRYEPALQEMLDQLDPTRADDRSVVLSFSGSALAGIHGGLLDHLDREGVDVGVEERFGFQFGAHRARPDPDEVWLVIEEGDLLAEVAALPGAEVLARATPLDEAEEAEIVELQARVAQQLVAAGREDLLPQVDSSFAAFNMADVPGLDPDDLNRLSALNETVEYSTVCRCGVVAVPAGSLPDGLSGNPLPGRPVRG